MLVHDVNLCVTEGSENLHRDPGFAQRYVVKFALRELPLHLMKLSIFVANFGK